MVKIKDWKNKENKKMTTLTLEVGDKFIPMNNKPSKEQKGDAVYPRYFMKVIIEGRDKEGEFIDLTPAQYKSLMNKVDEEKEVYNKMFVAYSYFSEEFKKDCIGVGYFSERAEQKNFEDFEEVKEE